MGHRKNKKVSDDEEKSNVDSTTSEYDEVRKPKRSKKKRQEQILENIEEHSVLEEPSVITEELIEDEPISEKKSKRKREKKPKNHIKDNEFDETLVSNKNNMVDIQSTDAIANETDGNIDEEAAQPEVAVKVERGKHKKNNNNLDDDKVIDWPEKDLSELFKRMEAAIPEKDTLAYSTRVEKLNWDDISFKKYSSDDCKCTWLLVQKRLRRFRLLNELLQDAKEWTSRPWTNFYGGQKTKRHPDMPRRPLSTYMLFYLQKKDKIIAENPGLEMTEISKIITQMYKALSPAKRDKYTREAAEKRKIYELEMQEFYRLHPEIPKTIDKHSHQKPLIETGPKKPNTPFALYYESQLKSIDKNVYLDKHAFKEQCKEQWKNMTDKKKVIWINWALDEETKYQDELKNYMSQNPEFVPMSIKPVLTKEEKLIKERIAGKPLKPPNSAYSLFSRMMLQSEEIKNVNPKDRMVVIAERWKNFSEEERKEYSERIIHLREQYKLDFASYLESLTEEKRQEELRSTMPKRKRSMSKNDEREMNSKKKKSENEVIENNNLKASKKISKETDESKMAQQKSDDNDKSTDDDKKIGAFAKPTYWNRMKKEEKRTFTNAMMKLKDHLNLRFEKYINSRASDSSEEDSDDSEDSDSTTSSS